MLRRGYRLPFRLFGIPVYLDSTFLVILPLLAWMIGSRLDLYVRLLRLGVDPATLQQGALPYILGLIAALGLFGSVLVHELGHSIVARRYGVEAKRITLWILGGVAQLEEMPRQRGAEATVAIAGPLTSFAVAAACWAVLTSLPQEAASARFVFGYLAFTNVALGTFNLLPALPLDGGRVLRSLLALRMPHLRATQLATSVSQVLAVLLGLFGFLSLNIFLVLIAFFVYMAGSSEAQTTLVAEMLEGIGVDYLMTREVSTVHPRMRVSELVDKMLRERHLGYPVLDDADRLIGMVTLGGIQGADPDAAVEQVMSRRIVTIQQGSSALEAFQIMSRNNFERLVVVDSSGQMVGIISKTDLVRAVQVRIVGLALHPEPSAS